MKDVKRFSLAFFKFPSLFYKIPKSEEIFYAYR